VQSSKTTYS